METKFTHFQVVSSFAAKRPKIWPIIIALWILVALIVTLLFTSQIHLTGHFTWQQAFLHVLGNTGPWIIFCPCVVWLADRFCLERPRWFVNFSFHLFCCIVLSTLAPILMIGWLPATIHHPADVSHVMGAVNLREPVSFSDHLIKIILFRGQFNVPIYWMIVGLSHASRYYRYSKEREQKASELEKHLTQAHLKTLQMQLQPHFLFNTLNAISTLVHKDPDAAEETIGNLSELLRWTLESSDKHEVPLKEELRFLDRYLEIQQTRFGDRLQIVRDIQNETLNAFVPNLILQPLVENAIRHGLESKMNLGILTIIAQKEDEKLQLRVGDNGNHQTFSSNSLDHPKEGVGLSNTSARLHELYGTQWKLDLQNRIEGGLWVTLEIPFHNTPFHLV